MRLVGAITAGSSTYNEDGYGVVGDPQNIEAAWILDGVTGINGRPYFSDTSDAAWFVQRTQKHLENLARLNLSLEEIVSKLVHNLIDDTHQALSGLDIPESFDPPAACLILVKRYGHAWRAVHLGDSCLLAQTRGEALVQLTTSPNNRFDQWLAGEAAKRRLSGTDDLNRLLSEFRPQLAAARRSRNTPQGYSILEAQARTLDFAHYMELGNPDALLLCTDGYYRAVDTYKMYSDEGLLEASHAEGGAEKVLRRIRETEDKDADCKTYPRFKVADDATAVMLSRD